MFPGWLQGFFRMIISNERSKGTRWSPTIRWSIGSMYFDNPRVYGDTSITDGLVVKVDIVAKKRGKNVNFSKLKLVWKLSADQLDFGKFQIGVRLPGAENDRLVYLIKNYLELFFTWFGFSNLQSVCVPLFFWIFDGNSPTLQKSFQSWQSLLMLSIICPF